MEKELFILTKFYDYLKWVSPIINRMPRDRKFTIGNRFLNRLYDTLEGLIKAKYKRNGKLEILEQVNISLEICRFYQRLLHEEKIWDTKRYKYSSGLINEIGVLTGNWIKSVKNKSD